MILHEFDPNPVAMINPVDFHPDITDVSKVATAARFRHYSSHQNSSFLFVRG